MNTYFSHLLRCYTNLEAKNYPWFYNKIEFLKGKLAIPFDILDAFSSLGMFIWNMLVTTEKFALSSSETVANSDLMSSYGHFEDTTKFSDVHTI